MNCFLPVYKDIWLQYDNLNCVVIIIGKLRYSLTAIVTSHSDRHYVKHSEPAEEIHAEKNTKIVIDVIKYNTIEIF